jgi:hypothetical protein
MLLLNRFLQILINGPHHLSSVIGQFSYPINSLLSLVEFLSCPHNLSLSLVNFLIRPHNLSSVIGQLSSHIISQDKVFVTGEFSLIR